ncbi:MAG: BspA family leucine-rich repeat surface protein [Erysipelotrichaceae bacterium]|nr:BspA family leucine-rich repeat surface protein [Erysipelotrichaceae bacterium]
MNTKLLKILISTAIMVPFVSTAVLADSDTSEGNPDHIEISESAGNKDASGLPDHILFKGTDGVNWYIDDDHVLSIEAGELNRDDHWKSYQGGIRKIIVHPNHDYDKLILPENCEHLFSGCRSLKDLDTSRFDTGKVKNMNDMFGSCTSLQNLDLTSFDTSKVTTMNAMFTNCRSLENLDLSSFDTSEVKNMESMFYNCRSLNSLNLSNFETPNLEDLPYMFAKCSNLECLDLSGFDTSMVPRTGSYKMFSECSALQIINISKDYFKGNMALGFPDTGTMKWRQAENHGNRKTWTEMSQTWNDSDQGWWELSLSRLNLIPSAGPAIPSVTAESGSVIDLSQYIPEVPGYVFTGWYTDPDCWDKAEDQNTITLDSSVTLYAGLFPENTVRSR